NNAPNKELLLYNIDSIAAGSQKALKRISTPLNRLTFKLIPVGNACYLSESDQIMMNYLTLYDSDFNNLSEGLVIPDEISEDLSMLNKNLRAAAFSPQICFNKAGDKFCCCLSNSDYIEIFHLTDNNIKSIYRNYTFLPEIEILSNIKYAYKNLRGGIRLCSCTDKYIYLLVYNHILELAQDELGNGNDLIYIFNWDGTPEKAIQLDHKIGLFTIDKDDRTLYAFTYGEEIMKLVKYDLQ
ncbi:MAG: BF3164 family lipoprotein, partial [Mariniphaga sp.]